MEDGRNYGHRTPAYCYEGTYDRRCEPFVSKSDDPVHFCFWESQKDIAKYVQFDLEITRSQKHLVAPADHTDLMDLRDEFAAIENQVESI